MMVVFVKGIAPGRTLDGLGVGTQRYYVHMVCRIKLEQII